MILPAGYINYWAPGMRGYVSEFGHAFDWETSENWLRWDCDWIEPLRAFAPRSYFRPQDTTLSSFDLASGWNNKLREVTLSGNPAVNGLQFYDGAVYESGLPFTDTACMMTTKADWVPRWALYTVRNAPPPGQGCGVYIMLGMSATHTVLGAGQVTVVLPMMDNDYNKPFLHWVAPVPGGLWNVLEHGQIVKQFAGNMSVQQGGQRDVVVFEAEEVWRDTTTGNLWASEGTGRTFIGTHMLIRTGSGMTNERVQWTHWWTPDIRILTAPLILTAAGAVQSFVLSPVIYGGETSDAARVAYAEPDVERPTPTALNGTWATEGKRWVWLATNADDWTIAAETSPRGNKPLVSMTRDEWAARSRRPILWHASTETPAVISTTSPSGTWPINTSSTTSLQRLSVTLRRDWKGARGTAEFLPQWPDVTGQWRENGPVEVYMGLQGATGLHATQLVLSGRIAPGGIKRRRTGADGGKPGVTVEFGDFYATALQTKAALDVHQARGRCIACKADNPCSGWSNGYCWLHMLGNRLGLTYNDVSHWQGSSVIFIPLRDDMPSEPMFTVADGSSWQSHIAAVEAACGVRVTFDKNADGKLAVDTGAQAYVPGSSTIHFTLDEDEDEAMGMVIAVSVDRGTDRWRNMVKLHVRRPGGDVNWYWIEPEADRLAGIADDWATAYSDDDAAQIGDLWRRFWRDDYRHQATINWTMPLCPGLRPDMFVQLNVNGLGLSYGSIFQITEHTMRTDAQAGRAESQLTAVQVYPATEGPY